jgi:uncharacterized membrane protein YfcA
MEVVVSLAAFLASALTLFSGFGLGTLLMPVVALFFPVDVAVGITALVHLANNLFKLGLVGWRADPRVVLRFGLPAVVCALAGAWLLGWLSHLQPLAEYTLAGREFAVMPVKLAIGLLILTFVAMELSPAFAGLSFDARLLPLGGCVSSFFGGLSGNQGAFRSMFLLKAGLTKEQFVATSVVLAVIVDLARIPVYGLELFSTGRELDYRLVAVACLAAFAGSFLSARLLKKITLRTVRVVVGILLAAVSLGFIAGAL